MRANVRVTILIVVGAAAVEVGLVGAREAVRPPPPTPTIGPPKEQPSELRTLEEDGAVMRASEREQLERVRAALDKMDDFLRTRAQRYIERTEQNLKEYEEEQKRWIASLRWRDLGPQDGVVVKVGIPETIERGVPFTAVVEYRSDSATVKKGLDRLLAYGSAPFATLEIQAVGGAGEAATIEQEIFHGPGPPGDEAAWGDLSKPLAFRDRARFRVPLGMKEVADGEVEVQVRVARREEPPGQLKGLCLWRGELRSTPVQCRLLPATEVKQTLLLPKRLRWMTPKDGYPHTVLTYAKEDAEEVTISYSKGSVLGYTDEVFDESGEKTLRSGLRGGLPEPDDVNGFDQNPRGRGPITRRYRIKIFCSSKGPEHMWEPREGEYRVLWERDFTATYEPPKAE